MAKQEMMSIPAMVRFEQKAARAWFTERHDGGSIYPKEKNNSEPKPNTPSPTCPEDWFRFRHGVWE